jgi:16S rRNA (guanine966-N2)-methyltransferase
MRVVAGQFKGRRLQAPEGRDTRPTIDRVREALMSAIYSARGPFEGASVLDAFAGSGALGIEALSRGASHCTFLDTSRKARKTIERNVETLRLSTSRFRIVSSDAYSSASRGELTGAPFDLVFLDPPYADAPAGVLRLIGGLGEGGMLSDGALCVYEHDAGVAVDERCEGWTQSLTLSFARHYGDTGVSIIAWHEEGTS